MNLVICYVCISVVFADYCYLLNHIDKKLIIKTLDNLIIYKRHPIFNNSINLERSLLSLANGPYYGVIYYSKPLTDSCKNDNLNCINLLLIPNTHDIYDSLEQVRKHNQIKSNSFCKQIFNLYYEYIKSCLNADIEYLLVSQQIKITDKEILFYFNKSKKFLKCINYAENITKSGDIVDFYSKKCNQKLLAIMANRCILKNTHNLYPTLYDIKVDNFYGVTKLEHIFAVYSNYVITLVYEYMSLYELNQNTLKNSTDFPHTISDLISFIHFYESKKYKCSVDLKIYVQKILNKKVTNASLNFALSAWFDNNDYSGYSNSPPIFC